MDQKTWLPVDWKWALLVLFIPLLFPDGRRLAIIALKTMYSFVKHQFQRTYKMEIKQLRDDFTTKLDEIDAKREKGLTEMLVKQGIIIENIKHIAHDVGRMKAHQNRLNEVNDLAKFEMDLDRNWYNPSEPLLDLFDMPYSKVVDKGYMNALYNGERDKFRKALTDAIIERRAFAIHTFIVVNDVQIEIRVSAATQMIDDNLTYFGLVKLVEHRFKN